MFDALLRMQLGPIVERLAEMESQLEDLYRRAESFVGSAFASRSMRPATPARSATVTCSPRRSAFSTPVPVHKPNPHSHGG